MTEDQIAICHAMNGALVKFTLEQCRYNCNDKKEVLKVFEALATGMMNHNRYEAEKALEVLYKVK